MPGCSSWAASLVNQGRGRLDLGVCTHHKAFTGAFGSADATHNINTKNIIGIFYKFKQGTGSSMVITICIWVLLLVVIIKHFKVEVSESPAAWWNSRDFVLFLYFAEKVGAFEGFSGTCCRFNLEVTGQTLDPCCLLLVLWISGAWLRRQGYEWHLRAMYYIKIAVQLSLPGVFRILLAICSGKVSLVILSFVCRWLATEFEYTLELRLYCS